ncbi:hypothetical protein ABDB91_15395 [Desulfoscipio sp. XC116]|uniref:hypothetical protein n=1 Tax=Desulfoscipio sp. XC116 TaxID=3144975 RepID=UPI00325BD665
MRRFALFICPIMVLAMIACANEQVNVYDQQKQLVKNVMFMVGSDMYFVDGQKLHSI